MGYAALSRISHQRTSFPRGTAYTKSESCAHKEVDTWWVGYTYSLACNTPLPFPPLFHVREEKWPGGSVNKERAERGHSFSRASSPRVRHLRAFV